MNEEFLNKAEEHRRSLLSQVRGREVKGCPFCGAVPEVREEVRGQYVIECCNHKCPTYTGAVFDTGCTVGGLSVGSVVDKWNTRVLCL